MEYNFCNGYTACETKISKDKGELFKKNDWDEYILIQKDESWNISSITKWELEDNKTVNWETSTIPTFKNTAETYKLWTWENEKTIVKKEQQTS